MQDFGSFAWFGVVWLVIGALWLAGTVFWILKIVEVARIPEPQYRAAGTDKTSWVVIVVVIHFIGALIWQFGKRSAVLAAAAQMLATPAGWYPEPGSGALRWWDGYRWTGVPAGAARRPLPAELARVVCPPGEDRPGHRRLAARIEVHPVLGQPRTGPGTGRTERDVEGQAAVGESQVTDGDQLAERVVIPKFEEPAELK